MANTESPTTPLPVDDSQITPAVPTFLEENVEGFQQCIKEILQLIEQDENFTEITADVYNDKKLKLTARVADLSRLHGVLVDQQVQLIEETSKNSQTLIKKQNLDSSDYSGSSSPRVTQMFTPDQMSNTHKFRTPIGFDVLLSSGGTGGGGSYASKKEASESTFSLSSDSDSESFMSINKLLVSPLNGDGLKETKVEQNLLQKISDLEQEVVTLNTKVQTLADENSYLKLEIEQNESEIISRNADLETERIKVVNLEKQVSDLEKTSEDEILKLKNQLSIEASKLNSTVQEISLLQKQLESEKQTNLALQEEVSLFVADISVRNDQITELKHEISLLKAKEETRKTEITEKCQLVDDMNKTMDSLKLKNDTVTAQLDTLRAEKCSQDNLVRELEARVNSLQLEHAGVVSSFHNAESVANGLKMKVVELEREVEKLKNDTVTDQLNTLRAEKCSQDNLVRELEARVNSLQREHAGAVSSFHNAENVANGLKMKVVELEREVEKLKNDTVTAQLDTLRAEKCSQDNLVRELEARVNSLQREHAGVVSSFHNAENVANGLKMKVVELEREVEKQREVIEDRAEEKREVIRQLSFSLEHYMSGYKQLLHAYVVGKSNRRRSLFT